MAPSLLILSGLHEPKLLESYSRRYLKCRDRGPNITEIGSRISFFLPCLAQTPPERNRTRKVGVDATLSRDNGIAQVAFAWPVASIGLVSDIRHGSYQRVGSGAFASSSQGIWELRLILQKLTGQTVWRKAKFHIIPRSQSTIKQ